MQVNEVVVNGATELSLVNDTVSEDTLLENVTAHDASGKQITGKVVVTPVDSELNAESENAIQNKAVFAGINNAVNGVKEYANGIISNPNLLDNPDSSINQRGLSEYRGDGLYCTDRWFIQAPGGELVVTVLENGGVHIENNVGNSGILQRIEENIIEEGNVYTISVDIDEKRYSTQVVPDKNNNANISRYGDTPYYAVIVFDVYNGVWAVYPYVVYTTAHSVDVGRAKLELGSVATPFVPPNPALESIKCQRMLQYHSTGDISPIDLRPIMRITPTVVQQADGRWMYNAEL